MPFKGIGTINAGTVGDWGDNPGFWLGLQDHSIPMTLLFYRGKRPRIFKAPVTLAALCRGLFCFLLDCFQRIHRFDR